jgi:hypothetical protein
MPHFSAIYLLLAAILFPGLNTRGQSPIFGIYFTAGNIRYVPARGSAKPLDPHTWLKATDKLILLDNIAEITLFDHDSSYVRLHGKGTYAIAEIENMPRNRVGDTLILRYLSFLWQDASRPDPHASGSVPHSTTRAPSTTHAPSTILAPSTTHAPSTILAPSIILTPRDSYATSMDSLIFRWHSVSWARKYFLRLRHPDGHLCYDSVLADTQAIVHFPGRMFAGNSYTWGLDIVGESGRLQFVDSSHIVLVNESAVLPRLPPVIADSIGGIAILLQRIEQYENAGCILQAEILFRQLLNDFPQDAALDKLYSAFRQRNYF